MSWHLVQIVLWTIGGICWCYVLACLLLLLNRQLAWVGWWFYHAAMAAAEHKRAMDELDACPPQHQRLHELAGDHR